MINEKMRTLGANRSAIRELFEYANQRRAAIGAENVFDFTIGNPNVPPPSVVDRAIAMLAKNAEEISLHAYTSAQGSLLVRRKIAAYVSKSFGFEADAELIYLTAGAAGALTCVLTAILSVGDEVIVPSPYFPEYKVFTERTGASLLPIQSDTVTFQPNISAIQEAITEKTQAIIVNSPNNPTGVVYSRESLCALAEVLSEKSRQFGHPIYLIADEPYRELAYDDIAVPYIPSIYDNSIVCYSFSKSLSIPGERIGYALVSPRCEEKNALYEAVCGAGRALGFVCAPSLFQLMLPACLGKTSDISVYDRNRKVLCKTLAELGFHVAEPKGAFYMFLKAPNGDANAFCEAAKAYELIFVPSDDFGCKGYVRIAYCVKEETILRSLPAFRKLASRFSLTKNEENING